VLAYDEDEELLKGHVVDNGKGIRQEEIIHLFQMFGKLRRTAAMNHEGIGMGLMICQNLVRLNGGTINVHSLGEDKGSTFSFSMKMKIDPVNENCDLTTFEKQEMDAFIAPMDS
jgi:K+-sensing histidine kinase KdpD